MDDAGVSCQERVILDQEQRQCSSLSCVKWGLETVDLTVANFGICHCQCHWSSEARPSDPRSSSLILRDSAHLNHGALKMHVYRYSSLICCSGPVVMSQDSPPTSLFPLVDERSQTGRRWPLTRLMGVEDGLCFLLHPVVPNLFRKWSVWDGSTDASLPGVQREIKPAQKSSLSLSDFQVRQPVIPKCCCQLSSASFWCICRVIPNPAVPLM